MRMSLEAERTNQSLLHKVVCASSIDEDDDVVLRDASRQTQSFGCQVTQESVEAYLGLVWVGH